jgi:hypothetical protein
MVAGTSDVNAYFRTREAVHFCGSVFTESVVWIAIQPAFAWLRGRDDRMSTGVRMFAGMTIRRAVAAQCHAAGLTRAKMNPVIAELDAFFAFTALRLLD